MKKQEQYKQARRLITAGNGAWFDSGNLVLASTAKFLWAICTYVVDVCCTVQDAVLC